MRRPGRIIVLALAAAPGSAEWRSQALMAAVRGHAALAAREEAGFDAPRPLSGPPRAGPRELGWPRPGWAQRRQPWLPPAVGHGAVSRASRRGGTSS